MTEIDELMDSVINYSKRARMIIDYISENIYTREEYVSLITQLYEPIRKEKEKEKEEK